MLFSKKLFFYLVAGFILFTAIGTVTHELAHFLTAKSFGYNTTLHHNFTSIGYPPTDNSLSEQLLADSILKTNKENFLITLAGPVKTMLTGTLAFLLLTLIRRKKSESTLIFMEWILVFMTFFWSRQLLNFLFSVVARITGAELSLSDEIKLAQTLELPPLAISLITAVVGLLVLSYTFFRLIPARHRITLFSAGMVGATIGYFVWMKAAGPLILP